MPFILFVFTFLMGTVSWADTTTGLVGWWKFNEASGTSALDSSGKGNIGTLNNAPTWISNCVRHACLKFNASNSTVTIDAFSATTPSNPYTIAAWVYIPTTASLWGLFDYGKVRVTINETGASWCMDNFGAQPTSSNANVVYNQWVHIAISQTSGGTFSWYINGTLDKTVSCGAACDAHDVGIYIGGLREGYYSGAYIDDFRVYNRVLSAQDVYMLYLSNNKMRSSLLHNYQSKN